MVAAEIQEHVHIVIAGEVVSSDRTLLLQVFQAARRLVPMTRIHLVDSGAGPTQRWSPHELPDQNLIVEPEPRGKSPAIAYAGCHLYRRDPNSLMVYVNANGDQQVDPIPKTTFEEVVTAADRRGSLVSLNMSPANSTKINACSVYSLMEAYRNYCPVDFQIINEIARTWSRNDQHTTALYRKLACEEIESLLLNEVQPGYVQPGYSTRNVFMKSGSTASILCSDMTSAEVAVASPNRSGIES